MLAPIFKQQHYNGKNTMDQPENLGTNQAQSVQQTTAEPNYEPEKEDIVKSWDGPVWDSRYGRFENQEDAAADDRKDLALHRCEVHQCNCRVPFQHRSYIQDMQRRIEPMVGSLVRLEKLVETLIQHTVKKGESLAHHSQGLRHNEHEDERTQEESKPKLHLPIGESVAQLEKKVDSLMYQLHEMIQNNDSLVRTGRGVRGKDEVKSVYGGC